MNHCSSEGATVGIKSYLSSRLKLQFKTKISKPKTISVQFQIKMHFNIISIFFSIQNQYPKLHFKILFNSFQKSNIKLSYEWDHTIKQILNYYLKSKIGIKTKEWVVFNKLEDFNSLLKYTDDDLHQLVIYVISLKMVKCYQLQLCKNFTTSDGIFNISLMKMNSYMMMMSGPIL